MLLELPHAERHPAGRLPNPTAAKRPNRNRLYRLALVPVGLFAELQLPLPGVNQLRRRRAARRAEDYGAGVPHQVGSPPVADVTFRDQLIAVLFDSRGDLHIVNPDHYREQLVACENFDLTTEMVGDEFMRGGELHAFISHLINDEMSAEGRFVDLEKLAELRARLDRAHAEIKRSAQAPLADSDGTVAARSNRLSDRHLRLVRGGGL
jgi:hypothetical protein